MPKWDEVLDRPTIDWIVATVFGVLAALALRKWQIVPCGAPLSTAMFATAGVMGTMSGFLSASLLFTAGIDNRVMKSIRRRHGARLNNTLLGATFALLTSALGAVICGVLSDGWGARAVMFALVLLSVVKLARVGLVLRGVLSSVVDESTAVPPGEKQTPVA